MKLAPALKQKLDQRVDEFIREMKPSNSKFFTYSELMRKFKKSLQEFSEEVYEEKNNDFIDEQINNLEENITPSVRELTDGTDEIITSVLAIEIAKIIYSNNKEEFTKKEIDIGRKVVSEAIRYLYPDLDSGPHKKVFNNLGKYIYRNQQKQNIGQGSGCIVILFAVGSLSTIFSFYLV